MTTTPLDPATFDHADLLYRFWYGSDTVITLAEIAAREGVKPEAIYLRYRRSELPYPVIRVRDVGLGVREADYIPGTKKNGYNLGVMWTRKENQ